ncbi:unnamed protein product [Heterobilharzia americana]|nr:unnamed protein product [Heterobilharzia americana]
MCAEKTSEFENTKYLLDYLKELLTDRTNLLTSPGLYIHVGKILEKEILNVRSELFSTFGICPITEKELPVPDGPKVSLQAKIYMPTGTPNNYNFVGRILGPEGSTAKCLQQFLGVKIMIRGRGSMRDQMKEEAYIGRPNWEHLNDNLHVLITVEDYENRAKARIEKASEYISLFLEESIKVPDREDKVKLMQSMELSIIRKDTRPLIWPTVCNEKSDINLSSKMKPVYAISNYGPVNMVSNSNEKSSNRCSSALYYHTPASQNGQSFVPHHCNRDRQQPPVVVVPTSRLAPSMNGGFPMYRNPQQPNHPIAFASTCGGTTSDLTGAMYLHNSYIDDGNDGGVSQCGFSSYFGTTCQQNHGQPVSSTLGLSFGPLTVNYWPVTYSDLSSQHYSIQQPQYDYTVTAAAAAAATTAVPITANSQQQYQMHEYQLCDNMISSHIIMNDVPPLMIYAQQQCEDQINFHKEVSTTRNNLLSTYSICSEDKQTFASNKNSTVVVKSNEEYNRKLHKYPVKSSMKQQVNSCQLDENDHSSNKNSNFSDSFRQPTVNLSKRRYSHKHNNLSQKQITQSSNTNGDVTNNVITTDSHENMSRSNPLAIVINLNNNDKIAKEYNTYGMPNSHYVNVDESEKKAVKSEDNVDNIVPSLTALSSSHSGIVAVTFSRSCSNISNDSSSNGSNRMVVADQNRNHTSQDIQFNTQKLSHPNINSVGLIVDEIEWPRLGAGVNSESSSTTSPKISDKSKYSSLSNVDRQLKKLSLDGNCYPVNEKGIQSSTSSDNGKDPVHNLSASEINDCK